MSALAQAESLDLDAVAFDLSAHAQYPLQERRTPSAAEWAKVRHLAGLLRARAQTPQNELPAFPAIAARVLNLLEAKEPDLLALVSVIRQDAVISSRVLSMANTAFQSRGFEITTVQAAATRLGMRAVTNVAVASATRALLDDQERTAHDCFRERWRKLSQSSMHTAAAARWLSARLKQANPEEAFLAGLLLDLGKVIALRLAGHMVQDGDLAADVGPVVLEGLLDETHVELGTALVTFWHLPGYICHVVGEHHAVMPAPVKTNTLLHLVRLASGLLETRTNPRYPANLESELFWSAAALGLSRQELEVLSAQLFSASTAH